MFVTTKLGIMPGRKVNEMVDAGDSSIKAGARPSRGVSLNSQGLISRFPSGCYTVQAFSGHDSNVRVQVRSHISRPEHLRSTSSSLPQLLPSSNPRPPWNGLLVRRRERSAFCGESLLHFATRGSTSIYL